VDAVAPPTCRMRRRSEGGCAFISKTVDERRMATRSQRAPQINVSALPHMLALHGVDKCGIVPFQVIFKGLFQARMGYVPGVTVTEFRHLGTIPQTEVRSALCFKVSDQRIVTDRHAQTEQPTLSEVEMIN